MNNYFKGFTSFQLKVIGLITMTIDHIGFFFADSLDFPFLGITVYWWLRIIGRIAFPIFAFLVANAVFHTKNFKKYFLTLFTLGIIFQVAITTVAADTGNVFLTLAFGALAVYGIKEQKGYLLLIALVIGLVNDFHILGFAFLDYGLYGIIMILSFGIAMLMYRQQKIAIIAAVIIPTVALAMINIYCLLAIPFLLLYNEKKGKSMKYFFYAYYPLHIVVLYFLSQTI